ncbi:MAG: thiamine phosphate synthase [Phycisphaeraceae bacterium]
MTTPRRITDANANRSREALRVIEEAARFLVQDAELTGELKAMRHAFTSAIKPFNRLIADRDTQGDVGTRISTEAEQTRDGPEDVVLAAGSRLAEALRAIEEYAKINSHSDGDQRHLVSTCERLRYQSYDVVKRLVLAIRRATPRQWRLCLLLTESLCTFHSWHVVLQEALDHGVDAVQVREKDMPDRALLEHIDAVRKLIASRAALIVNDRPDLAKLSGADGVHLGQSDIAPRRARQILGQDAIIGVSTARLDEAKRAQADGADYCGVGPMFPTTTKHKPKLAGTAYLREYRAWNGLPHLAIGGITPDNIDELVEAGCRGVAVSSAICSTQTPGEAAQAFSDALPAASVASDTQIRATDTDDAQN